MPDLMKVRDLDGELVNGYRTINVLGVTPQRRALLYHRLYSSKEESFISEPHEVQTALQKVGKHLAPLAPLHPTTWIMDSQFDDVAVWRTIWEQEQHLVCRACHMERTVEYNTEYKTQPATWALGSIEQALPHLRGVGSVQAQMEVRLRGQKYLKRQRVGVQLRSCPLRLHYQTNVRRNTEGEEVIRGMWLMEVTVPDSHMQPMYLLTDWPCSTPQQAARIFQMYRQRWSVEEAFQFLKTCVGWEEVQVLDLEGVRTLVALGWVAAGFLYEIDGGWEWADVELLAKLGGFEPHKGRKPGKKVLLWGLQMVQHYLIAQAVLRQHKAATGSIPPGVAALLGKDLVDQL
jgi:hypothetical protein